MKDLVFDLKMSGLGIQPVVEAGSDGGTLEAWVLQGTYALDGEDQSGFGSKDTKAGGGQA